MGLHPGRDTPVALKGGQTAAANDRCASQSLPWVRGREFNHGHQLNARFSPFLYDPTQVALSTCLLRRQCFTSNANGMHLSSGIWIYDATQNHQAVCAGAAQAADM